MPQSFRNNLTYLYLIKIAKWFMLFMPIVVPFYQSNGLEMRDVFTLQAIYSVAIVVLEIPSGYLADVLGRRKTLIIGTVLGTLGFGIYTFSYGFWGFLMAEMILGFGQSLISGADSAMLYDSLVASGKEKQYIKFEGRMVSVGNFAETIAGILGGLLAEYALRAPYIGQTFIAFIGVPAAFLLVEPERHKQLVKARFSDILKIVKYSLWEHKELKWNIFFSSVIGASTLTMAWFVQPYFAAVGIPLAMYGVLWGGLNLLVGVSAMYAHKVERRVGQIRTMFFILLIIPLGYVALSQIHVVAGMGILILFYVVRGIATPVLKDYINRLSESNVRATVLSVRNFVIRVIFAIIGPFVGWYTDTFSLHQALFLSGIVFFVLSSIIFTMHLLVLRRKS